LITLIGGSGTTAAARTYGQRMMTAAQLEQHEATTDEVVEWRFEQLVGAGYEPRKARVLSRRREVDLHQAVELLKHGCSHELALSILL
jgi:hypothetical protein